MGHFPWPGSHHWEAFTANQPSQRGSLPGVVAASRRCLINRWGPNRNTPVEPAVQRRRACSASWASSWAIRRSANRLLDRAACSRSSRVRLSWVSCRTRCLSVVFSVMIRWMVPSVSSCSASRSCPRSCPDPGTLGADLSVRGLEGVLSVKRPLPPGRLLLGSRFIEGLRPLGGYLCDGLADESPGTGAFVEECARHRRRRATAG